MYHAIGSKRLSSSLTRTHRRVTRRTRLSIAVVARANRPRLVPDAFGVRVTTRLTRVILLVPLDCHQSNRSRIPRPVQKKGSHASARDRVSWSVEAPLATMAERFGFETGKLVMSQFRSRTRIGRKKRLLEEAEKILRSGAVEQPKWFNALKT